MKKSIALLITAFFLLTAGLASADVITVTLDGVPATQCGETWTEAGVVLSFVQTTAEDDCPGSCFFGVDTDRVWLYPARLNLDLTGLTGTVTQVEVDIIDHCRPDCTRAFLYDGATTVDSVQNSLVSTPETLKLSSGGASVDRAAVSSCEGVVIEIRLTTVPCDGWPCVYDQSFRNAGSGVALSALRKYRDKVLKANSQGAKLVGELYEQHSEKLADMLLTHPKLMASGARLVNKHLAGIESVLSGGTMEMTPLQLLEVRRFLSELARLGDLRFKLYIRSVQKILTKEGLEPFGIKIVSRISRAAAPPRLNKSNLTTTWGDIRRSVQGQ